jgi:hypothetical protein
MNNVDWNKLYNKIKHLYLRVHGGEEEEKEEMLLMPVAEEL